MKSAQWGSRKSAGGVGAVVLRAILFIIAMALPLSAQAPGQWAAYANLNRARANHAAAALPNGQALIVGGVGASGTALKSAEIFNLSGNTFTTLPTGLPKGVSGLTATVLNDGTVLLAGGQSSSGKSVSAAELYNPSTSAFIKLPAMKNARSNHTATLLQNGSVLLAGGGEVSSAPLKTLEIYNPAKKTFALAAPLHSARQDHTATLLDNGSVLIAGGSNASGPLASAEIYDPTTNTVSEAGSLNEARTLATASELLDFDGSVLIAGGQDANGHDLDTAEEFDPTTDRFTTLTAQMITPRSGHVGVTLPYNGKVLIAGGTSGGTIVSENEVYDPVSGTFVANEPMSVARDEFAANFFALPNVGQVLMTGGVDSSGEPTALTEMFSYPTIRTDKQDYPPGSPVIIYGTGWTPGEQVDTIIAGSNGENDVETDTADSSGSFSDYNFEIGDAA